MHDAAFGPMPGMGGGLALAADPLVLEAQRLLKQLGYDPGPLDGVLGQRTRTAMEALAMATGTSLPMVSGMRSWVINEELLVWLRGLVARAAQQPRKDPSALTPPTASQPPRFWESKLFPVGVAVAAVGLYLVLRGEKSDAAEPVLADHEKKRCSRTPKWEQGEVIEGEVVKVSAAEGSEKEEAP